MLGFLLLPLVAAALLLSCILRWQQRFKHYIMNNILLFVISSLSLLKSLLICHNPVFLHSNIKALLQPASLTESPGNQVYLAVVLKGTAKGLKWWGIKMKCMSGKGNLQFSRISAKKSFAAFTGNCSKIESKWGVTANLTNLILLGRSGVWWRGFSCYRRIIKVFWGIIAGHIFGRQLFKQSSMF